MAAAEPTKQVIQACVICSIINELRFRKMERINMGPIYSLTDWRSKTRLRAYPESISRQRDL